MSITLELPSRSEAERLLKDYREKASFCEREAEQYRRAITSLETQLAGKLPPVVAALASETAGQGSSKRKKGENMRRVQDYLAGLNGKGATMAELSKATKTVMSSVQAVLTAHSDIFARGEDGFWRLKESE